MSEIIVDLPSLCGSESVSVLELEEGEVFESGYSDEYGVRTDDGWVTINRGGSMTSFIESELSDWGNYQTVNPRPDLQCTIKIGAKS